MPEPMFLPAYFLTLFPREERKPRPAPKPGTPRLWRWGRWEFLAVTKSEARAMLKRELGTGIPPGRGLAEVKS